MGDTGGCTVSNIFCELFISSVGPNVTIKYQTLLLPALLEQFPELQNRHLKEFMESDAHTQCSCVKTSVRLARKNYVFWVNSAAEFSELNFFSWRNLLPFDSCCPCNAWCNGTLAELTYGITSYLSTWGNHFEFVSYNDWFKWWFWSQNVSV